MSTMVNVLGTDAPPEVAMVRALAESIPPLTMGYTYRDAARHVEQAEREGEPPALGLSATFVEVERIATAHGIVWYLENDGFLTVEN